MSSNSPSQNSQSSQGILQTHSTQDELIKNFINPNTTEEQKQHIRTIFPNIDNITQQPQLSQPRTNNTQPVGEPDGQSIRQIPVNPIFQNVPMKSEQFNQESEPENENRQDNSNENSYINNSQIYDKLSSMFIEQRHLLDKLITQQEKVIYKVLFQKIVSEIEKDISVSDIRDYLYRFYLNKASSGVVSNISISDKEIYALSQTENDINFLYSYFEKYVDSITRETKLRLKKEYEYIPYSSEDIRDISLKLRKEEIKYIKPIVKTSDENATEVILDIEYDTFLKKHFVTQSQYDEEQKSRKKRKKKDEEKEESKSKRKDTRKVVDDETFKSIEYENIIYKKRNDTWQHFSDILSGEKKLQLTENGIFYDLLKNSYIHSSIVSRDQDIDVDKNSYSDEIRNNVYKLDENNSIQSIIKQNKQFLKYQVTTTEHDDENSITSKSKPFPPEHISSLKKQLTEQIKINRERGEFIYTYSDQSSSKIYNIQYNLTDVHKKMIENRNRILGSIQKNNFVNDDYTIFQLNVDFELRHLFGSYDLKSNRNVLYPTINRCIDSNLEPFVSSEKVMLIDVELEQDISYGYKNKKVNYYEYKEEQLFKNYFVEIFIDLNTNTSQSENSSSNGIKNKVKYQGIITNVNSSFNFDVIVFTYEDSSKKFITKEIQNVSSYDILRIWEAPTIDLQTNCIHNETYMFLYPEFNNEYANYNTITKRCILKNIHSSRERIILNRLIHEFIDESTLSSNPGYETLLSLDVFKSKRKMKDLNNPLFELYCTDDGKTYFIEYDILKIFLIDSSTAVKNIKYLQQSKSESSNHIYKIDNQLWIVEDVDYREIHCKDLNDILLVVKPLLIHKIDYLIKLMKDNLIIANTSKEYSFNTINQYISEVYESLNTRYGIVQDIFNEFIKSNFMYDLSNEIYGIKDFNDNFNQILNQIYIEYNKISSFAENDESHKLKVFYKKRIYLLRYCNETIMEIYKYIKFETIKNKSKKSSKSSKIFNYVVDIGITATFEDVQDIYIDYDVGFVNRMLSFCNYHSRNQTDLNPIFHKLPSLLDLLHQSTDTKNRLSLKIMNDNELEALIRNFGYQSPKVYTYQLCNILYSYNHQRYIHFCKQTYIPYSFSKLLDLKCTEISKNKDKLLLLYKSIRNVENKIKRNNFLSKFIDNYCILTVQPDLKAFYKIPYRNERYEFDYLQDDGRDIKICIHEEYYVKNKEKEFDELKEKANMNDINIQCSNCYEAIGQIEFDTFEKFVEGQDSEDIVDVSRESGNYLGDGNEAVGIQYFQNVDKIDSSNIFLHSNFVKDTQYRRFFDSMLNPSKHTDKKSKSVYQYLTSNDIKLQDIEKDNIVVDKFINFINYQQDYNTFIQKYKYSVIRNKFIIPFFIDFLMTIAKKLENLVNDFSILVNCLQNYDALVKNSGDISVHYIHIKTENMKLIIKNIIEYIFIKPITSSEFKNSDYLTYTKFIKDKLIEFINKFIIQRFTSEFLTTLKSSIDKLKENNFFDGKKLLVDGFLLKKTIEGSSLSVKILTDLYNDLVNNFTKERNKKYKELSTKLTSEGLKSLKSNLDNFNSFLNTIDRYIDNDIVDPFISITEITFYNFSISENSFYNFCIDNRNLIFIIQTYFNKNITQRKLWLTELCHLTSTYDYLKITSTKNETKIYTHFYSKFYDFLKPKKQSDLFESDIDLSEVLSGTMSIDKLSESSIRSSKLAKSQKEIRSYSVFDLYDKNIYSDLFGENESVQTLIKNLIYQPNSRYQHLLEQYGVVQYSSDIKSDDLLKLQTNCSNMIHIIKNIDEKSGKIIISDKKLDTLYTSKATPSKEPKKTKSGGVITIKTLKNNQKNLLFISFFHSELSYNKLDVPEISKQIIHPLYEKFKRTEQFDVFDLTIEKIFENICNNELIYIENFDYTNILISLCFHYINACYIHQTIKYYIQYYTEHQLTYDSIISYNETDKETLIRDYYANFPKFDRMFLLQLFTRQLNDNTFVDFDFTNYLQNFIDEFCQKFTDKNSYEEVNISGSTNSKPQNKFYDRNKFYDKNKLESSISDLSILYDNTNKSRLRVQLLNKYVFKIISKSYDYEKKSTLVNNLDESEIAYIQRMIEFIKQGKNLNKQISLYSFFDSLIRSVKQYSLNLYIEDVDRELQLYSDNQINSKTMELKNISRYQEHSIVDLLEHKKLVCVDSKKSKNDMYNDILHQRIPDFTQDINTYIQLIQYLNLQYLKYSQGLDKPSVDIDKNKYESESITGSYENKSEKSETTLLTSKTTESSKTIDTNQSIAKFDCNKVIKNRMKELSEDNNVIQYKFYYLKILEFNDKFQFEYFHYLSNLFAKRRTTMFPVRSMFIDTHRQDIDIYVYLIIDIIYEKKLYTTIIFDENYQGYVIEYYNSVNRHNPIDSNDTFENIKQILIKKITYTELEYILLYIVKIQSKNIDFKYLYDSYLFDTISQSKDEQTICDELLGRLNQSITNRLNSHLNTEKIVIHSVYDRELVLPESKFDITVISNCQIGNQLINIDSYKYYVQKTINSSQNVIVVLDRITQQLFVQTLGLPKLQGTMDMNELDKQTYLGNHSITQLFNNFREFITFSNRYIEGVLYYDTQENLRKFVQELYKHPDETKSSENTDSYKEMIRNMNIRNQNLHEYFNQLISDNHTSKEVIFNTIRNNINEISSEYFELEKNIMYYLQSNQIKHMNSLLYTINYMYYHNLITFFNQNSNQYQKVSYIQSIQTQPNLELLPIVFDVKNINIVLQIFMNMFIEFLLQRQICIVETKKSAIVVRKEMYEKLGDFYMVSMLSIKRDKKRNKTIFMDFAQLNESDKDILQENAQIRVEGRMTEYVEGYDPESQLQLNDGTQTLNLVNTTGKIRTSDEFTTSLNQFDGYIDGTGYFENGE